MAGTTKPDGDLLDAAVRKAGGSLAALARAFGLEPNAVKQWPRRGVPRHMRPRLEAYVTGELSGPETEEATGQTRVERAILDVMEELRLEWGEDSPKWAGVSRAALEIRRRLQRPQTPKGRPP